MARRCVWSRNLENEEAKARYRAVKIQPQWVVTPGKQTNKLLLLLLLTAIELSLGGSSPYTSTNKTNKNKYTKTKQYIKQYTQKTQ